MANDFKAKIRELERKGWIVKNTGKHPKIVSPGGAVVSHSHSPSDVNAINQFERDIRRVERREHQPQKEKEVSLNHHPVTTITPRAAEPKVFGDHLFPQIKALAEDGLNYIKIADMLNKQGYQRHNGTPLAQYEISHLLLKHGYRKRAAYKRDTSGKRKKEVKEAAAPSLRQDLEAILSSNMDPDVQERLLRMVVKQVKEE